MIFNRTLDNLNSEDVQLLNDYFDGYEYESAAHTLLANYIWRNTHDISWQIFGEYLCLESRADIDDGEETHYMSFPLTRTGEYDPEGLKSSIDEAKRIFEAKGQKLRIARISKDLAHYITDIYGNGIEISHDREDDEYIYERQSLENLSGRKLHAKKNNLNHFRANYDYEYIEATPDMADDIRDYVFYKNEYKMGETPEEYKEMLELETQAICEYLKVFKEETNPGLAAGVIKIEGKIMACELGEYGKTDSKETMLVHFEKADDRIRGLYQAINWEFVRHLSDEVKYINREEDMGLETLRKAKESYQPLKLAEKYSCEFL